MGKKKTPEEKAKRAREKGFNDDDNGIDDSLVLKKILPYTTGVYNEQMDMWREYVPHPQIYIETSKQETMLMFRLFVFTGLRRTV
jgi:hypothetical protein